MLSRGGLFWEFSALVGGPVPGSPSSSTQLKTGTPRTPSDQFFRLPVRSRPGRRRPRPGFRVARPTKCGASPLRRRAMAGPSSSPRATGWRTWIVQARQAISLLARPPPRTQPQAAISGAAGGRPAPSRAETAAARAPTVRNDGRDAQLHARAGRPPGPIQLALQRRRTSEPISTTGCGTRPVDHIRISPASASSASAGKK